MTEDVFTNNVKRIEIIYSTLIKGESNPQKEVEMRIELIDALSNIEASLISEKQHNEVFIALLANLREALLNWDPYGQWFRQQKNLVDSVYEVMITAKNVVFARNQEASSEATRLKTELDALKSELSDLRSLMSSLVSEQKPATQKTTSTPSEQPAIEPPTTESETTSRLPWKRQETPEEKTATTEGPPLMLPLEPTQKPSVSAPISPPPQEIPEVSPPEIEQEEKLIVSDSTLEKMEKSSEATSSTFLNQMKSLIDEAEKKTEKQISDFKKQYQPTDISPPIVSDELQEKTPPIMEPPVTHSEEKTISTETSDNWVKPSEIIKQKELEEPTSTGDPYMQLLTLEAEKYRLEKEVEKNETDFQEGLKSKKEFDETIIRINQELAIIREQIDSLRKQLTS